MRNRSSSGPAIRTVGRLMMVLALIGASVVVAVRPAQAFTSFSAPLTGGTEYITGFTPCTGPTGIGPIGVLHDGANFFTSDWCSGTTYKFTPSGGALPGVLSLRNGFTHGLWRANGRYYGIARGIAGVERGLYTFDPSTLARGPRIAVIPGDARQVMSDPTGDAVYVSSDNGIFRVDDPNGTPAVTKVASGNVDGMVFTADGQHLWAAYIGENRVKRLSRNGDLEVDILTGHRPDGLAVARPDAPSGVAGNVFANNNDGTILRIDTNRANVVSIVALGGTRGDFATVGPDGCFYVTQSNKIVKLAPCFFEPPPSADLSVVKTAAPSSVLVLGQLTYTLTVRNGGPSRATSVMLTDTLPADVHLLSASAEQGTCTSSGRTVICDLGTLERDATTAVTIVVSAPLLPGNLFNTATVEGAESDPDLSNNTSSVTTPATLLPVPPLPSPAPSPAPSPSPYPSPSVLGEQIPLPPELPRTGPAFPLGFLLVLGSTLVSIGVGLVVRRKAAGSAR